MPLKRKAAGKAGKGKASQHVPAASYFRPYRDLPQELIVKIFENIEDPVTATSFGLANHRFHKIFQELHERLFRDYTFPLDPSLVLMLEDKSQLSLRYTLRSFFPANLCWDFMREKFIPVEDYSSVCQEMLDTLAEKKQERHEQRREEKEIRQEERATRKTEKEELRRDKEQFFLNEQVDEDEDPDGESGQDGDAEEDEYDDEPPKGYEKSEISSDEDSESGKGSDTEVEDNEDNEPDWEATGIPKPSREEWIAMSNKG
ncbi:hypothetical protein N431DRAFT_445339 [Stipitochalara longipes BDJ]|nr:hypothetical protein N431DRAFT_445339 [Stipitochalara longipes BDJ]